MEFQIIFIITPYNITASSSMDDVKNMCKCIIRYYNHIPFFETTVNIKNITFALLEVAYINCYMNYHNSTFAASELHNRYHTIRLIYSIVVWMGLMAVQAFQGENI